MLEVSKPTQRPRPYGSKANPVEGWSELLLALPEFIVTRVFVDGRDDLADGLVHQSDAGGEYSPCDTATNWLPPASPPLMRHYFNGRREKRWPPRSRACPYRS
jgi:hypothetical protein